MSRDFDEFSNPVAVGGKVDESLAVSALDVDEEARQREEERLKNAWCGLLHPDTTIRHIYDLAQLAIMFYLGYQLPLRLAFNKPATGALEIALTVIIDASVWVDMYMQMNMAYAESPPIRLLLRPCFLAYLSPLQLLRQQDEEVSYRSGEN